MNSDTVFSSSSSQPWRKVAVYGAGQLGVGIAYVCLLRGLTVSIVDNNQQALDQAQQRIEKMLERAVKKNTISDVDSDRFTNLVHPSLFDAADIADCDVILEAVSENRDIKEMVLNNIVQKANHTAIVASNTSSFSITALGKMSGAPERTVGIHFMNPSHVIPLVEIIAGLATHPDILKRAQEFVTFLGKKAILCKDQPAFIVNRILIPMINDAAVMLENHCAEAHDIDQAMKLGANFPMGPLELGDFIGLDTVLSIMENLYSDTKDARYRPCLLLRQYVDAGWLGVKSKRGFFTY